MASSFNGRKATKIRMKKHKTSLLTKPKCINPYNSQHIGRREEQQDYFAYSDLLDKAECERIGAVAVLADGMGGMKNGRAAAKTAVEVFMSSYSEAAYNIADISERMIYAVNAANEAVRKIDGAGSTICAAVIKDWQLYWVSVGDSRLYLYRNESVRQLNHEHNYENVLKEMVQNGEISVSEMMNNSNRAALTSYLGIDRLTEIDINKETFPLFCGDSVMLCSDGLYRALSEHEISQILRDAEMDVCDVLANAALSKGDLNQDNITVALMDLD